MNSNNNLSYGTGYLYNRPSTNRNLLRSTIYTDSYQPIRIGPGYQTSRQMPYKNKNNQFCNQPMPQNYYSKRQHFDISVRATQLDGFTKNQTKNPQKIENKSFDLKYSPSELRSTYDSYISRISTESNYDSSFGLQTQRDYAYNPQNSKCQENKTSHLKNLQFLRYPSSKQSSCKVKNYDYKYDLDHCKTSSNQNKKWNLYKQQEISIDYKSNLKKIFRSFKTNNPQNYSYTMNNPKQNFKPDNTNSQQIITESKKYAAYSAGQKNNKEIKKSFVRQVDPRTQKPLQTTPKIANNNKKIKISDFVIIKKMGKGRLGEVLQVVHKQTGCVYAIKKLLKQQIIQNDLLQYIIQQIKYQLYAQSPNIIKLYAVFDDITAIYFVMQLADEGSLERLMNVNKYHTSKVQLFEHNTLKEYFYEILSGIKRLHQLQLVHRDLKPGNIVLVCGVCKICDFGWASSVSNQKRRSTYCGSMGYAAPQIFQDNGYDLSVDVWQFGVIAYELLTGKQPFYNTKETLTIQKLKNFEDELDFPSECPTQFKDFISKFLKKDPQQRCSVKQMLEHELLQNISTY